MSRPTTQHAEPVNGDSFLDIVASVVSIMIIMVVMEGMRIKNAPPEVALPASPAAKELERTLAAEQSLRGDVWKMAEEAGNVKRQAAARGAERDLLATVAVAAEDKIQERRQQLGRGKQADFDLLRGLEQSRYELKQLVAAREQVENQPAEPIVVESYPTPISRTVDGPEAHLLISNGRVVFVPIEALVQQVKVRLRRQGGDLSNGEEMSDTVGPLGGFRLRYTLERRDIVPETMKERGGSVVQVKRFELVPESNDLGEPVRLALRGRVRLPPGDGQNPAGPDDRHHLGLSGRLRCLPPGPQELYRLGYAIAARPLPPGTPISGSPEGSKSAAQ